MVVRQRERSRLNKGQVCPLMSGDKNIVTLEAADNAAFYIYVIKFLSKHNDKNLITFPTDDKNIVTFPI